MRELLKRLLKVTAGYGLVQWAGPLLSLVFTPIVMRALGPADYGAADYILTCFGAFGTLALFALPGALQTHYNDSNEPEARRKLVGSAIALGIVFSLLLGFPLAAVPETMTGLLGIPAQYAALIRLTGLLIWPGVAGLLLTTAAQSALRVRWGMTISVATIVTISASNILLIVVLNLGAFGLVTTQLILGVVTFAVGLIVAKSLIGRPDLDSIRRLARSGATLLPTAVASWAISVADRFFLVRVISITELGYYATAVKFASLLGVALSPLFAAWIPIVLSGLHDDNARERFPAISRYLVAVALFGSLCLTLFSTDVVSVLGLRDYARATPYIGLLTYTYIFAAIGVPLSANQVKLKKLGVLSFAVVLGAVVNMALNVLLIPRYGIWGAVIATAIGYGVPHGVTFLAARRAMGIPYPMRIVLAGVAGHLALTLLWTAMPELPLDWRLVLKFASLMALGIWCVGVGLITRSELQSFRLLVSSRTRS